MLAIDPARLTAAIARLHAAPQMAYVVCSGAGAGVTRLLWSVAGCSRTLIGSEFPYAPRAVANLMGWTPRRYSSSDVALALATAAYLKAQQCLIEQGRPATPIIGLGLAAAVATDRIRRGDDTVFVAIRTADGLATVSGRFGRGRLSRAEEGEICDLLAINGLFWAAGIEQVPLPASHLTSTEVTAAGTLRPAAVTLSLEGAPLPVVIDPEGTCLDPSALSPARHVLFPGSFNPLHYGHDLMAQTVGAMTGKQVVFEIAAANADKPPIDPRVLARRALQFRGRWPVLLSEKLPLYIDKARAYGGFSFIVGLDTATRLVAPQYFAGEAGRDAMVRELRDLGTTLYVCNRGDDAEALARFARDPLLEGLVVPVPMLIPVSSSTLRAALSANA